MITKYNSKSDLKKACIDAYIETLRQILEVDERRFNSNWASTGSEYHNECRERLAKNISEVKRQLKLLTT